MKSKKGMTVFIMTLFILFGAFFLASATATADSYDHYFSGHVYYNGAPVSGAKVYLIGYFECWTDTQDHVYWHLHKTLTTNANGYFSGNMREGGDFTRATLTAKYAGIGSYTVYISYPTHDNPNIILSINNPPPDDDEDPCGPYPNCN